MELYPKSLALVMSFLCECECARVLLLPLAQNNGLSYSTIFVKTSFPFGEYSVMAYAGLVHLSHHYTAAIYAVSVPQQIWLLSISRESRAVRV